MLTRLLIRNYLLVEEVSLDFSSGFTAMTGETGAGKSMILGALEALLGGSLGDASLRDGADRVVIDAEFHIAGVSGIESVLGDDYALDSTHHLTVRRELARGGRARNFVQDRPAPKDLIETLRSLLVDFHGQRDSLSIFRSSRQLEFLDAFAGLQDEVKRVAAAHHARAELLRELAEVDSELAVRRKEQALLSYQLEEIERLGLREGEEGELTERLKILEHSEKLVTLAGKLAGLLDQDEISAVTLTGQAKNLAVEISRVDSSFATLQNELAELSSRLKDIASQAARYADLIEVDPSELDSLRKRAATLAELRRKHGMELSEILAQAVNMKSALEALERLEQRAKSVQKSLEDANRTLISEATALSQARAKAAPRFANKVRESLEPLGFAKADFKVETSVSDLNDPSAITKSGADRVQFLFSASSGQALAPLTDVASGGESSRVTLAIKCVVAEKMRYPLLVYDEIDLGISGKVADAVGTALSDLAQKQQVIVITHLPQIAAHADHQLEVTKQVIHKKTVTRAQMLKDSERKAAVAALLSGAEVSGGALQAASDLLAKRKSRTKQAGTLG
ncbi:DNA repair protein RecN [bacterium]|nr:DNA repair protein RecN [bacterium]